MSEPGVVNASPFIILAQGGWLELLRLAGDQVMMPRPVEREVLDRSAADAAVDALGTLKWMQVVAAAPVPDRLRQYHLGEGEESVISWALVHPGSIAIMDDRRARRIAQAFGIPVTGTLGLVLEARRRGHIPAARPVVNQLLHATGWYLSPGTVDAALAEVGE